MQIEVDRGPGRPKTAWVTLTDRDPHEWKHNELREKRLRWFLHVDQISGAFKTVCDMQTEVDRGPGRPKTAWMTLTDRDPHEWKHNELREKRLRWFLHVDQISGTFKTVCDMQIEVDRGPGRPKTAWMTLTYRDPHEWKHNELREKRLRWFLHVDQIRCAFKTVCDMQTEVDRGPGRPNTAWMTLTDRDPHEWKHNKLDPSDRDV